MLGLKIKKIITFCMCFFIGLSSFSYQDICKAAKKILVYSQTQVSQAKNLILLNKYHYLPSNWQPKNLTKANKYVRTKYSETLINKDAAKAMKKMFKAAKKSGHNLIVESGYRSKQYQSKIFYNKISNLVKNYRYSYSRAYSVVSSGTAIPRTSEHQTGYAVDIVSSKHPVRSKYFGYYAEGKWLAKNSYKYGFILRYPANKTNITKIIYEPWHYRYIGVENAKKYHKSKLVFEQFYAKYIQKDLGF